MTRLRAEDLPPALCRQIKARAKNDAGTQGLGLSRSSRERPVHTRGTNRWTCAVCHETFIAYATAERHSDERQHHRIDLDVS